MSSRCPYCGNAALSADAPEINAISQGLDLIVYKCVNCGICSRAALDDEAADNAVMFGSGVSRNGTAKPGEEEILRSAQTLMRKQLWHEALDLLFKKRFPYEHPLEFIFYRNVCQTAVLFSAKSAVPQERSLMLTITALNLSGMNYYLAKAYPETKSQILQNLTEVFLLLGDAAARYSETHKDRYYHHCAVLFSSLADILESGTIGFGPYDGICLQTAVRLLHKCLEISREKPFILLPYTERQLKISSAERRRINDKINRINFKLCQIYPGFAPVEPLPAPKVISAGALYMFLTALTAAVIICSILFYIVCTRYKQLFGDIYHLAIGIAAALVFVFAVGWLLNRIVGIKSSERHPNNIP